MAALGCPILGDPKYGNLRYNRHADVSHQLLAACRLQFADLPPQDLFADLNGHIWYYVPAFCTQYGFGVARINALLAGKAIRDGKG